MNQEAVEISIFICDVLLLTSSRLFMYPERCMYKYMLWPSEALENLCADQILCSICNYVCTCTSTIPIIAMYVSNS